MFYMLFSLNFYYHLIIDYEFNLIVVKLVQEEALVSLLRLYHAASNVALYLSRFVPLVGTSKLVLSVLDNISNCTYSSLI